MPQLVSVDVANYRAFRDATHVDLKPIVLLYGRNNAGKSAILRFFRILADASGEAVRGALDLSSPAAFGAGFLDLLWTGAEQPGEPSPERLRRELVFALNWRLDDGQLARDRISLRLSDAGLVFVSRLESTGPDGQLIAVAQPDGTHAVQIGGNPANLSLKFVGLRPFADSPLVHGFGQRLATLRRSVGWLESVRDRPQRLFQQKGWHPLTIGPRGQGSIDILLHTPGIMDTVQKWYAHEAIRRDLSFHEVFARTYRLSLSPRKDPAALIDLADTGEGMCQVLPVLVSAALMKATGILAVEEPESHLHGDAQRHLARWLVGHARELPKAAMVLETHSRILLLGFQLAAAEGRLDPALFQGYWVDQDADGVSHLLPFGIRSDGRLENWPREAFQEEPDLARELLEVQLQQPNAPE